VRGQCDGNPRKPWKQRCEQGRHVTTVTQGHDEARQEWVWVAMNDRRHGRHSRMEFNVGFR